MIGMGALIFLYEYKWIIHATNRVGTDIIGRESEGIAELTWRWRCTQDAEYIGKDVSQFFPEAADQVKRQMRLVA